MSFVSKIFAKQLSPTKTVVIAASIVILCLLLQAVLLAAPIAWVQIVLIVISLGAAGVAILANTRQSRDLLRIDRGLRLIAGTADPQTSNAEPLDSLRQVSDQLKQKFEDAEAEIQRAKECDPLTGLGDRRWFQMRANQELERAARAKKTICLVIVKIADIRNINENYGYDAGDAALLSLADTLRDFVRSYDLVGRLAGDEFGVLLLRAPREIAEGIVSRLREAVNNCPLALLGDTSVDASFTLIESQPDETFFDAMHARAHTERRTGTPSKP